MKRIFKKKEEVNTKKIKILTLGDSPLLPSGVGIQSKYFCKALLDSGKFEVYSLAGAREHLDYTPVKTEEYGEDWIIHPVKEYGNAAIIRGILAGFKPDIVWFMTDPRFYEWLWDIEDEIRPNVPMVYYHVWDNFPTPTFNEGYYQSTDVIHSISKVTRDIINEVMGEDYDHKYVPHCVEQDVFQKLPKEQVKEFYNEFIGSKLTGNVEDRLIYFWNNRNGRRKQPGSLIFWFKEYLDKVGHDRATLIMHTEPRDEYGQDLYRIIEELGLTNGQIVFSTQKYDSKILALIYNAVDCTINISDAEGFGLSVSESLNCGTPVIVNLTGGMTEQIFDGEEYCGIGIEPCSKAIIGSQVCPWIYEDRIGKEDFINALMKFHNLSPEQREELGERGIRHMQKNFNFKKLMKFWPEEMERIHKKFGSWPNKQYKSWELREV